MVYYIRTMVINLRRCGLKGILSKFLFDFTGWCPHQPELRAKSYVVGEDSTTMV